jgi:hypothetical protein
MLSRTLTVCLAALALTAADASADVVVAGTGEPAFTNSANNTQWVEWSNNGAYRVEFHHVVNGGATKVDGPYNVASTGSTSVNWSGIAGVTVPLAEGSTYAICGFGRWNDGTGMWFPDFSTSCGSANGKRTSTTIDRTKPVISLDAPAVTRSLDVPITIGYADNLAYPFGVAFVGVDSPQLAVLPGCAPDASNKVTTFRCAVKLPATDGAHTLCAVVPDAAVPDNPNSADQSGTATQANRSDPKCREVVLDRAAPQVTVTAPADLEAGSAGLFVAQIADGASGVTGATWNWGDGTTSNGADASHVFAAPGTYRVRFTVADAAGNTAEVVRDVTVRRAPSTDVPVEPTPTPVPSATPTPTTPGPSATPTPTTPGPSATPSPGGSAKLVVRVRRASGKSVRLSVTGASGSARVVLKRGGRVVASKRVTVKAGVVSLSLPRKLASGMHVVEVTVGGLKASATIDGTRARMARAPELDPRGLEAKLP